MLCNITRLTSKVLRIMSYWQSLVTYTSLYTSYHQSHQIHYCILCTAVSSIIPYSVSYFAQAVKLSTSLLFKVTLSVALGIHICIVMFGHIICISVSYLLVAVTLSIILCLTYHSLAITLHTLLVVSPNSSHIIYSSLPYLSFISNYITYTLGIIP